MHPKKKEKYISRLIEIVDGATSTLNAKVKIPRPRTDGSSGFALDDGLCEKRSAIISDLLKKDGWIRKYSQEYLEKQVDHIVSKNVGTPDNSGIATMFSDLCDKYSQFASETTVLIPLDGIALKTPELKLGKIRLFTVTDEYLSKMRADAAAISEMADADMDTVSKKESLDRTNEMINQFSNTVCAERTVVAESTRAQEIAREELRLTVAILNFLADALTPRFFETRVGIKGEFFRGLQLELTRANDSIRWAQTVVGPKAPLVIDEKALKLIDDLKISTLADLATEAKFDATKTFEGTILTALHFHSHARELPDPADKLLSLITAIEAFFETSQKSIAATIASGCALVLCNKIDDRIKMKTLVKKLYGLRSSISHHGERTVLKQEINELSVISWQLICFAIQDKARFKDKKEFNLWVEKLELGLRNELSLLEFRK
ncbi:MAG: hypothetical protein KF767_12890 [Bdellovibrionaceae bacterium]|nr:hypothetical protein [Pseudobdellovibrionaceae bacterium]